MPLTPLTPEQRADALVKAGQVRKERADLKGRLKREEATLAEVLKEGLTSDVIGKMKVSAVIEALPGMGKVKTRHLMENLNIKENRRVRGLSDRQRAALEAAFAPIPA
jgi:hypothetical protein